VNLFIGKGIIYSGKFHVSFHVSSASLFSAVFTLPTFSKTSVSFSFFSLISQQSGWLLMVSMIFPKSSDRKKPASLLPVKRSDLQAQSKELTLFFKMYSKNSWFLHTFVI